MKAAIVILIVGVLISCDSEQHYIDVTEPPFSFVLIEASFDLPGATGSQNAENIKKISVIASFDQSYKIEPGEFYYEGGSPNDISISYVNNATRIRITGTAERVGNRPHSQYSGNPAEWAESFDYDFTFQVFTDGEFRFVTGNVYSSEFQKTYYPHGGCNNYVETNDIEWAFEQTTNIWPLQFKIHVNDVYGTSFKN